MLKGLVSSYFNHLAIRFLTRGERKILLLSPRDSAVVYKCEQGLTQALLADDVSTPPALTGVVWVAALTNVSNDQTGQLNMRSALRTVGEKLEFPPDVVDGMINILDEAYLEKMVMENAA